MNRLEALGASVTYHDLYVAELKDEGRIWNSQSLNGKMVANKI